MNPVPDEIRDDPPTLDDIERAYIIAACIACDWRLSRAAALLGVAHKTLYNKLHRYQKQGFVERRAGGNGGWQLKANEKRVTQEDRS